MEREIAIGDRIQNTPLLQLLTEGSGVCEWVIVKRGVENGEYKKAVFYSHQAGLYAKFYNAQSGTVPIEVTAQNFQAVRLRLNPRPWAWKISRGDLSVVFSREFGPSVVDGVRRGIVSMSHIPALCSRLVDWMCLIEDKTGLYNRDINPHNVLLVGGVSG